MSVSRLGAVLGLEFRSHLKRPLVISWILLLALLLFGLSQGAVRLGSGDATVGGTKATITSEFALAQTFAILVPLLYTFFVAVLLGLSILRDDELGVGELLHATPLRPAEYAAGKFGAGALLLLLVLGVHVLLAIFFNHVLVDAASKEFIGDFHWPNYARAALVFGLPACLLTAGVAFWIGVRTRSAVAVFVLPLAGLAACIFFLWQFTPTWLDPRVDRLLMWIDPTGLRWLTRTWLDVDHGVTFYNQSAIPFDTGFLASRIGYAVLGIVCGLGTALRYQVSPKIRRVKGNEQESQAQKATPPTASLHGLSSSSELAELGMGSRRPSLVMGYLRVLRVELRELRAQPGLYIFIPLIVLQTVGQALFQEGPFGTELQQTSGLLAVRSMPTLTLLVSLLLMFYTVESLRRERKLGLAGLINAAPTRTAVILGAKISANAVVGACILLAALVGNWIVLQIQGVYSLDPKPFLIVWGGLLVPTFVLWCAFVAWVYTVVRNSYGTYAIALAALVGTGWLLAMGHMNWARNWILWSSVNWTDFGVFPLDRGALIWNRALALGTALMLFLFAHRLYPRRERDPQSMLLLLRPRALCAASLPLLPLLLPILATYFWISSQVAHGWEGEYAEREQKDYWRRNVETWRDAPQPDLASVDVALNLEPETRRLTSRGSFVLQNHSDQAFDKFALTGNPRWDQLTWTLDGQAFEPENRAGLYVFAPPTPLGPEETTEVGFELSGILHPKFSKNGAQAAQFVLPEGVVLHSFSPTFVPTLGYQDGVGIDEENRTDAKDWAKDYYVGTTPSGFGHGGRFDVRLEVTMPERFTINGVGRKTLDRVTDGKRTVVWETDHPVDFFNVVAGQYAVAQGEETAIYYLPAHAENVPDMLTTLDAARARYSEWFYPYPWSELKLSEFPALATYAQGFATNITFSEGVGFLSKPTEEVDAAFFITAHESAHQWWGNLLVPGRGPGANILSEGMAHFSTILLTEAEKGPAERIAFCRRIEERYGEARVADSEKILLDIDGSRPGDTTVTYDKGGWVFWMLYNLMGREACLAGLQDFITHYLSSEDHPVLQDFTAHMRDYAPDQERFDAFVEQWFQSVVVPRFSLSDVHIESEAGQPHKVRFTLANTGSGQVQVTVAALAAKENENPEERSSEEETSPTEKPSDTEQAPVPRKEARIEVEIGAGQELSLEIPVDFAPARLVVDPDAMVLQLERKLAEFTFE